MKFFNILLLALILAFTTVTSVNAQKAESEMTCEEYEVLMQEWQLKVQNLEQKLEEISKDLETNKEELASLQQQLKDCNKELYSLLGATLDDIEAFRQRLGKLDGKVRNMERRENKQEEIDAVWAELNEIRKNKLALLPEFYNKIVDIARRIKNLKVKEERPTGYTVGTWAEDRDCLWNIAGKMEIYGDPFQWPKIWHDNMDKIRNPDIIHPGQVLTIPPKGPKTDEELKMERRYWRQKREESMQAEQPQKGGNE